MSSTVSPPTQAESFEGTWPPELSDDGRLRPTERSSVRVSRRRPSRGRRATYAFVRFLITLGLGIGGTLAWQSYGDEARQMIAQAYPQQLGWLAPQPPSPASVAQITPATVPPAPPAAPSVDPQQVKGMLLGLAVANQRVDQLTTKLDLLQQQTADEIAKLQASQLNILDKISTPPSPPPPPARKPAPRTPPRAAQAPSAH